MQVPYREIRMNLGAWRTFSAALPPLKKAGMLFDN
jgi:hypothetical protein